MRLLPGTDIIEIERVHRLIEGGDDAFLARWFTDAERAYCSGKAGLAMFTRAIVLETEGKGIRVFGFSPGTIDTEMQVKIRASGMNMISQIPRGDLSPVADAVRGLVYLCGAEADDLIGQDASMRDDAFRARIGL